ncbi:MAG: hypothetical protein ABFQ62_04300 [Patescibacteria group bacterium]
MPKLLFARTNLKEQAKSMAAVANAQQTCSAENFISATIAQYRERLSREKNASEGRNLLQLIAAAMLASTLLRRHRPAGKN